MATDDRQKSLPQTDSTTKTSMAPSRYETNRDIALLADLGMGYKKIAKYKNMPVSTVQGVVSGIIWGVAFMMLPVPVDPQSKPPSSSSTLKPQLTKTPGLPYERSLKP